MTDLTIAEAAIRLGISKQAMRTRVRRGQVDAHKDTNGEWRVAVSDDTPLPASDIGQDVSGAGSDAARDARYQERSYDADAVIALLREQLAIKDRQISELHVMLQTAQRQLPATIPDAPQTPERPGDDASPVSAAPVAPGGARREIDLSQRGQRRSWLARLLGWE